MIADASTGTLLLSIAHWGVVQHENVRAVSRCQSMGQSFYLHVHSDLPGRLWCARQWLGSAAAGTPTLDCL